MAARIAMPDEKPEMTFEKGLESLEQIVGKLESGDLDLVESLQLFERGVLLSQNCRKQLEEAESKVEALIKRDSQHQPEPFQLDEGELL